MNSEDLNQIRAVVREEIGASEGRLREEFKTFLREEIQASEVRSQEFARDIETHLQKEMQRGFDRLDRRFEGFERRVERVEYENVGYVEIPLPFRTERYRYCGNPLRSATGHRRPVPPSS